MAIEIVDFPSKNGGSFHSYVSLPEGIHLARGSSSSPNRSFHQAEWWRSDPSPPFPFFHDQMSKNHHITMMQKKPGAPFFIHQIHVFFNPPHHCFLLLVMPPKRLHVVIVGNMHPGTWAKSLFLCFSTSQQGKGDVIIK